MSSSELLVEAETADRYDVAVLVPCYNEERAIAIPIFITYVQQGLVPRLPTAVLSTGLILVAVLSIACGLILDTVTRGRREAKLIAYLALRAPGEERRRS